MALRKQRDSTDQEPNGHEPRRLFHDLSRGLTTAETSKKTDSR